MKTLSEFLEVLEGVEFKIHENSDIYKIENNTLKYKNEINKKGWVESDLSINYARSFDIKILPKQILTDPEKEYLKAVIKPFKDENISILKAGSIHVLKTENNGFLSIQFAHIRITKDLKFEVMKSEKPYTPADLGLEE